MQQLTPRQLDYLRLAAYSNRQIGLRLGVSPQTVKNMWRLIYLRLGVDDAEFGPGAKRLRAVLKALRYGYVELVEIAVGDVRLSTD